MRETNVAPRVLVFRVRSVFFYTRCPVVELSVFVSWIFMHKLLIQRLYVTTQFGAFCVRNVTFCVLDARTMLALTTDQVLGSLRLAPITIAHFDTIMLIFLYLHVFNIAYNGLRVTC